MTRFEQRGLDDGRPAVDSALHRLGQLAQRVVECFEIALEVVVGDRQRRG